MSVSSSSEHCLTTDDVPFLSSAEFKDLWRSLKTPIGDDLAQELQAGPRRFRSHSDLRSLIDLDHLCFPPLSPAPARLLRTPPSIALCTRAAGLTASSGAAPPPTTTKKKAGKGRKGLGSSNRRFKITNTHLKDQGIDLSKDYVPQNR